MTNNARTYARTVCTLPSYQRGFHLITQAIQNTLNDLATVQTGLLHLFLQHTSASLAISENACAEVATDLETFFNRLVLEKNSLYTHTLEGEDDMPAHIKSVLIGVSLTIPIENQQLYLGQWQGIYLCEHRNQAPARKIVLTLQGL